MEKMTLRQIVAEAVKGLQGEFLSTKEQSRLVDYILNWSSLTVTSNSFQLTSGSCFGVGEDNKNKLLPEESCKYIGFYWGWLEIETCEYTTNGIPHREWCIESYSNLEQIESMLKMRGEGNLYPNGKGEFIVLFDGKLQEYKHLDEIVDGLHLNHIEWIGIEPYKLFITTVDGGKEEESYNSIRITELRVLQILRDMVARTIQVYNILEGAPLPFTVKKIEYSTINPFIQGDISLEWQSTWGIPGDDEIY